MLDFLFSAFVAMIEKALSVAVDKFLSSFNVSREAFDKAFPFAAAAYDLFQDIGLVIVLFICICQVINLFRSGDRNRDTPWGIVGNALIAVAGIFMGNYILEGIVSMAIVNYDAILNTQVSIGIPEVGAMDMVMSVLSTAFYSTSILLYLILLILIGIQFIMVLLEAVERYVVLFLLLYLSPLFYSTLASKPTGLIFKKFFSMFVAQCILMVLNIWSVKMALSVFASIGTMGHNDSITLTLIMAFAFLRIAQRLDTYLNQCGINAAVTGAGLGADLFGGFVSMARVAGGAFGSIVPGAAPTGGGGVVGAAQKIAQTYGKYSPIAGVADGIRNHVKAHASTILGAVGHGVDTARSGGSFTQAATDYFAGNIGKATAMADSDTQGGNLFQDFFNAPEGFDTVTESLASSLMEADNSLTEEGAEIIRARPGVATAVMNKMASSGTASEITDNEKNAAMLAGMNLEGAENFVRASNGHMNTVESFGSKTTKDGMYFGYEEKGTGKFHSLEVKNHAQYSALSAAERDGFKEVRIADGSKKYVRIDGLNALPETQEAAGRGAGSNASSNPKLESSIGRNGHRGSGASAPVSGGPGVGLPSYNQGDYTDKEISAARNQAYWYHSGKELESTITPSVAGEIMDGYGSGGVMPYGSAIELSGSIEVGSASANEQTFVRPTVRYPSRGEDFDVDRVYNIANATGSKNVPRRDSVVRAHQNEDGIRLSTATGVWEMRPQKYVDRLPDDQKEQYKADYVSPRGNQYYTRFISRPSAENVAETRSSKK